MAVKAVSMKLNDLERSPGSIVAICVSMWALFVLSTMIVSWLEGSETLLPRANAALKGVLFAAVGWVGRERIDQVSHAWDAVSDRRRILFAIEVALIGLLVVIGVNALADHLIPE